MLRLNLKIAFRYLFKDRLYSFLNITGLALGIASFIIISLFVSYELNYDRFEGSDQVYRLFMDYLEGETFVAADAQTYNLSGPTFKKEFPEITEQVRLYRLQKVTFQKEQTVIEQPSGAIADETYFDIFNYPLISGQAEKLKEPNKIILNQTLATKLFGEESPIGKTVQVFWENEIELEVAGIMEDRPRNTHFEVNYLISFATIKTWGAMEGQEELNWNQNNYFTYVKVLEGTNIDALRQKIISSDFEDDSEERHNIEALADIHLHSDKPYEAEKNGSASSVKFLSAIGIIILLLSWLNYVNLSTAKSMERAREIGIRKVAGAQRLQIISQSLIESLLLNSIAIVLAVGIASLILPFFNGYFDMNLSFGAVDFGQLLPFLAMLLSGTLLSGLYPALIISKFSPVKALKGRLQASSSGIRVRKGLIVFQFFTTVILIVGTLMVSKQLSYLRSQAIGADLSQVIALKGEILEANGDSIMITKGDLIKDQLAQLPFVHSVARASTYPGDGYDNLSSTVGLTFPNGTKDSKQMFYICGAEPEYFPLMDLEFIAGRSYFKDREDLDEIVINATFASIMGYSDAREIVGKTIKFWGRSWNISGVVQDYHHFGLKTKIAPLLIAPRKSLSNLLVKFDATRNTTSDLQSKISQIEKVWKNVFPNSTLSYTFLDKKFEAQYRDDEKFGLAFQIFTGLAILIAMLGLFGLTSYNCIQRRKEIGIRKVSGASVFQILLLLNKEFIRWVALAFIVALPVAWYVVDQWLQEFAYRTVFSSWIFVIAGIIVVGIAIMTISFQALRAALANPVKSLRVE